MAIRPRSLLANSISSVFASGMLIFSTVLIPAVLARALTRSQFDVYSIILASLPLILILPQSMRTVGATQLALMKGNYAAADRAPAAYTRFIAVSSLVHTCLAVVGIELYIRISLQAAANELRFGLYCILCYTLGQIVAGYFATPAAAQRDFLPDNIAKFWPGLFQLTGVTVVWLTDTDRTLFWIFVVYAASSWSIAAILLARSSASNFRRQPMPALGRARDFFVGLRGILWWNLTAYLATTATLMVVAIGFPSHVVPFSIATSLLGIVSASLIAVSGPVAVHATASQHHAPPMRRRFFLLINTLFQGYIGTTALMIAAAPVLLYALWLTPALAAEVKWFVLWLLPATILRLLTMNFTIFVMSAGRQHTLWLSPLVEAALSLIGSIVLGSVLGIIGIPLALTFSAIARLLLTVVHDEPLNRIALALAPGDLLLSAWRVLGSRRVDLS